MVHGWPLPFCGVDRGMLLWGVMPPRQARGQPLHHIYALGSRDRALDEDEALLAASVFAIPRVVPTGAYLTIIEARGV
jgi:hypothetical protein